MVYCESYADEFLLSNLEGIRSVMMIGCPGCANTCVYLRDAASGSAMLELSLTGFKAVPMRSELNRLQGLFSANNVRADAWMGTYPTGILCTPDKRGCGKIIRKCRDYDTVVTVCCDGGTRSLERILIGKRIIPAMQARGLITALLRIRRVFTAISIDKSSAEIVKITP